MFYADQYSTAEYIGFGDTDCFFLTYVDVQDIFSNDGKPIVHGRIGMSTLLFDSRYCLVFLMSLFSN